MRGNKINNRARSANPESPRKNEKRSLQHIKSSFLVNEDATKTEVYSLCFNYWRLMIANTQDTNKSFKIAELTNEVKELVQFC